MNKEPISQEEIDALLRGVTLGGGAGGPAAGAADLSELVAALGPALEGAWAMAEALLGEPVRVSAVTHAVVPMAEAVAPCQPAPVFARMEVGDWGAAWAVLPEPLALHLVGLMLGTGAAGGWTETATAALAEAVSQLVANAVARVASQAGSADRAAPVAVTPAAVAPPGLPAETEQVVRFQLQVEAGAAAGPLAVILPLALARRLEDGLRAQAAPAPPAAAVSGGSRSGGGRAEAGGARGGTAAGPGTAPVQTAAAPAAPITYRPHQFEELQPAPPPGSTQNIELLLDVSLQVTVELGRTRKQIRDVLALGPGSVLELEKLAGEPVDVLVNGKLIARGEVVVIDEHFGVRITDIVSPADRAASLR